MVGHLADVITCAKFQDDNFRGYDFTGVEFPIFPIDFCMDLTTVQRDCAACDSMSFKVVVNLATSRPLCSVTLKLANSISMCISGDTRGREEGAQIAPGDTIQGVTPE